MAYPVQVTFRNMPYSNGVDAFIRDQAQALVTFCPDILGCHVVISIPHRHHERGNRCHAKVNVTLLGEQVVVNHDPSTHSDLRDVEESAYAKSTEPEVDRDAYVAVHHAFDAARRQIQDLVRRRRGDVKMHGSMLV